MRTLIILGLVWLLALAYLLPAYAQHWGCPQRCQWHLDRTTGQYHYFCVPICR